MAEPAKKQDRVYDPDSEQAVVRPDLHRLDGGGQTSGPPQGNLHAVPDVPNESSPAETPKPDRHLHSANNDDVKAAEEGASTPTAGTAEKTEQAATGTADDTIGSGYHDEGAGKPKKSGKKGGLLTRRRVASGGIIGFIVSLVLLFFSVAHGPLQFLHIAQLMRQFHFLSDENHMNGRTGQIIKTAKTAKKLIKGTGKRGMGFVGEKVGNHYEARLRAAGIEPHYQGSGNMDSVSVNPDTPEGKQALEKFREQGTEPSPKGGDGKVTINLEGETPNRTRKAVSGMVDALSMNKISSVIAKRVLKVRAGVSFHRLNESDKAPSGNWDAYTKRVNEERDSYRENGTDSRSRNTTHDDERSKDNQETSNSQEAGQAADEANQAVEKIKSADVPDPAIDEAANAAKNDLKTKGSKESKAAGYITMMCGVYELGQELPILQHYNIIVPLIRTAMEMIALASQIQSGKDVNFDKLGVISQDLFDSKTDTSWVQAKSIQAELGHSQNGPDIPDEAKPGDATPEFFHVVNTIVQTAHGEGICKWVTSTAGGWILNGAEWALSKAGPAAIAVDIVKQLVIGESISVVVRSALGRQLVKHATGALLGSYVNYGSRLAANDTSLSHGGRKLTSKQEGALAAEREDLLNTQMHQKSFFARYFDLNEPRSLAAKTLFENKALASPQSAVASFANIPATLFSNLANIFMPKAAAEPKYDYGFSAFGFPIQEKDNPALQDPYHNAELVEPRLVELNKRYNRPDENGRSYACFATSIDPSTFKLTSGKVVMTDLYDANNPYGDKDPNKDKNGYKDGEGNPNDPDEKAPDCLEEGAMLEGATELQRYRMYLSDMISAKSTMCYEGLDQEACQEINFGQDGSSSNSDSSPGLINTDFSSGKVDGDIGYSSDTVPCAAGTKDMGVVTSKYRGEAKKEPGDLRIRLCQVPDLPGWGDNAQGNRLEGGAIVNSRVAATIQSLGRAAKAAGTSIFANSSFRLNDSCGGNGDGSTCAKPGQSYHQLGVAIDFNMPLVYGSPTSCSGRARNPNDPTWKWLHDNAERYDYKQYSYESWHWDPAKLSNRCGTLQ